MSDATMCEDCGRWSHWPVVCPDCRVEAAGVKDSLTTHPVVPVVTEDARDAARYRFWRDKACNQPSLIARNLTSCLYTHEIDEAIDKLMDAASEVRG